MDFYYGFPSELAGVPNRRRSSANPLDPFGYYGPHRQCGRQEAPPAGYYSHEVPNRRCAYSTGGNSRSNAYSNRVPNRRANASDVSNTSKAYSYEVPNRRSNASGNTSCKSNGGALYSHEAPNRNCSNSGNTNRNIKSNDNNTFTTSLDLSGIRPDRLRVTADRERNAVTVEEAGTGRRRRTLQLPRRFDAARATAAVSAGAGVITLEAPVRRTEEEDERQVAKAVDAALNVERHERQVAKAVVANRAEDGQVESSSSSSSSVVEIEDVGEDSESDVLTFCDVVDPDGTGPVQIVGLHDLEP